jgi:hypothetical protein
VSAEDETPIVGPLDATQWAALSPEERLAHANKLHKQILQTMKEQEESSNETEE